MTPTRIFDMDELREFQTWYASQCDGDWEHEAGIQIYTLDNPGWAVDIALAETQLENMLFAEVNDVEPEKDWVMCRVQDGEWQGRGGPLMLARILRHFLDWAATVHRPAV